MTLKFIKQCVAPQQVWRTHCDCCGPEMDGWQDTTFFIGEEHDPEENYNVIDISKLKYNIDYVILTYP